MVERIMSSWKSFLFVFIQLVSLMLIGITGPFFADNPLLLFLELIGLGLGLWAVLIMRPGHFNIIPDPRSNSVLVRGGPYRLVRHPMYLALLITTLPLVLDHFTTFRLLLWVILLIDLVLKISYEEKLLLEGLNGYDNYMGTSHRLIPYIY
jgi:protein-S-isoprenylcysteine O-methyltransferase Ste14